MELEIFEAVAELLNMGGNAAMIALMFIMWKFDRRIFSIELQIREMWKWQEKRQDQKSA